MGRDKIFEPLRFRPNYLNNAKSWKYVYADMPVESDDVSLVPSVSSELVQPHGTVFLEIWRLKDPEITASVFEKLFIFKTELFHSHKH